MPAPVLTLALIIATVATAATAPGTATAATDWPPPRLLVLPPEYGPLATRHLDAMAKASLQGELARAAEKATSACVISPRDLRDLRTASGNPRLCGLPAAEALDNRYALRTALTFDTTRWELTATVVDLHHARLAAQLTLSRATSSSLQSALQDLIGALSRLMATRPEVTTQLNGILKEDEVSPCATGERAVDVEGTVTWPAADTWMVREYGAQRAAELGRTRATEALKRDIVAAALDGAFVWSLAQLSNSEKEVIASRPAPFDRWSKREVLQQPARWVTSEHPLPLATQPEAARSALALRLCVSMEALQAAVAARVKLLDPAGKPKLLVLTNSEPLTRALETLARRYALGPAGAQTTPTGESLDLSNGTQRAWLAQVVKESGASAVLLGRAIEGAASGGQVEVVVDLRLLDADGNELARRAFHEKAPPRGTQPVIHRVAADWAAAYPSELEAWILTW